MFLHKVPVTVGLLFENRDKISQLIKVNHSVDLPSLHMQLSLYEQMAANRNSDELFITVVVTAALE